MIAEPLHERIEPRAMSCVATLARRDAHDLPVGLDRQRRAHMSVGVHEVVQRAKEVFEFRAWHMAKRGDGYLQHGQFLSRAEALHVGFQSAR